MTPTAPRGCVSTPVTPFTPDNRIDDATVGRLIELALDHGADAFALPMHIGESLKLTSDERRHLAAVAVEAVAGRVPVYVHVSLPGTDEAVALTRHAEQAGADGVVVIGPYHWRPGPAALVEHFVTVASSTELAVIAYNYPERLGVTFTPDLVAEVMRACPNFVGLKDASLDMEYMSEVCRVTGELSDSFAVYTGIEFSLPGMVLGGAGCFSACGGVAPRLVQQHRDACMAGDWDGARPFQHRLSQLYGILKPGYPASIKVAMEIMGRPCGHARQPADRLDADGRRRLERALDSMGIMESEPHGWSADVATAAASRGGE
jgi:dihydrodipicolinate synthase/N-acetylneuraminate lyase